MKLFMFAASLRRDSCNKKLINHTANMAKAMGHTVDLAQFNEFDMPLYNADTQNDQGFPETVNQFVKRLHAADALIISSPEYNYSTPGTLKNLIDWISRVKPMPWKNQRIFLMSASPAVAGGNRGLWSTRIPLEACGALVYPDMFSLAQAHEAFAENGTLKDVDLEKRLTDNLKNFMSLVSKLI